MDLSMIIDQEIFKNEGEMDRLLYHLLVVELLSDKFIFTEGEPGLTGHQVNWSLRHLFLHGLIQEEQRLTGTVLQYSTAHNQ